MDHTKGLNKKMLKLLPKSAEAAISFMHINQTGTHIKTWELDTQISSRSAYLVRIDGVSFAKFTKGIIKPFDDRLTRAMVSTAEDLITRFQAYVGYHQSDEISLYFPAQPTRAVKRVKGDFAVDTTDNKEELTEVHMYNGRVQKLASVVAAFASVRLNHHLHTHCWLDLQPKIREKVLSNTAHFDGRIVPCSSAQAAQECLFWRSNFDGLRNSISHIAQHHIPIATLHKQSITNQIRLLHEKNVDLFADYSDEILYGTFLKREEYEKKGVDFKSGEEVLVKRGRVARGNFNWADWSEAERVDFVESKLWEARHPPRVPRIDSDDAVLDS